MRRLRASARAHAGGATDGRVRRCFASRSHVPRAFPLTSPYAVRCFTWSARRSQPFASTVRRCCATLVGVAGLMGAPLRRRPGGSQRIKQPHSLPLQTLPPGLAAQVCARAADVAAWPREASRWPGRPGGSGCRLVAARKLADIGPRARTNGVFVFTDRTRLSYHGPAQTPHNKSTRERRESELCRSNSPSLPLRPANALPNAKSPQCAT